MSRRAAKNGANGPATIDKAPQARLEEHLEERLTQARIADAAELE